MMNNRVVVGMSGGVDSSVAALLLKNMGYDVVGVTMQIWPEEDPEEVSENGGCCGLAAVDDAAAVADAIGIPYYVLNFRDEFKKNVIDYFTSEYINGRTPNPCIACNRYVKWEALLNKSIAIGADRIATGHYAKVEKLDNGRYAVKKSDAGLKDQTYVLYGLTQEELARTIMPLGNLTKDEVRAIARENGLPVAEKKESMEICFIPDNDHAGYIERTVGNVPGEGNFVDSDGNILGRHKGITHYTIGQRKGLGLSMGHPVFVTEIRPETNEVVIGEDEDLYSDSLVCSGLNWQATDGLHGESLKCMAKIRYRHREAPAIISELPDGRVSVRFDTPQRAATPGQAVVFYRDGYILGGGTIL